MGTPEGAGSSSPAPTWRNRAGPWLAIGTSPAGLALGAALAADTGTVTGTGTGLPPAVLIVGVAVMVVALWVPARLGLATGARPGGALTELAARALTPAGARALSGVLAVALAGWFAVNAAMGGAGLAAALDVPAAPTIVAVAAVEALLLRRGLAGWNGLAVAATLVSLALVVTTGARVDGPAVWVHDVPPAGMLATQMVAFVGYVAVFAIRSPDFTAGLARRRDLAAGVALLVLTTAASVVVGARLPALAETGADTGTAAGDLAARLGDGGLVPGGGAFLLLATLAPALVAGHSARRCLHALALPRPRLTGMVAAIAVTALAVGRPDRSLLPWLAALGAALPALVVPLTLASRRRRGRAIPTWTWLPGVAVAVGLGLRWHALGLLTGLAVTGLATYGWSRTADTEWPEPLTQRRFTS